ncbi:MAG: hypothetical protein ACRDRL_09870 [Sciscionella sp.]
MGGMGSDRAGGPDDGELMYVICDVEQVHPERAEVRAGVNYPAVWRRTQRVGDRLARMLVEAGFASARRAGVAVRADGGGLVTVELELSDAAGLADLVDSAMRERQEGARSSRGAPHRDA